MTLDTVLRSDTLPTLPAVAARILAVTEGEEADLSEITDVVSQDLSLATRILKVVNSPFYGLLTPVGTVKKAVSVLGITPVRSLVLSFSMLGLGGGKGDSFDYSRFWEHSLAAAVTARRLMKEIGAPEAEEGFTAGLLANVGEMLLARACPAHYRWVLQAKGGDARPPDVIEREILGLDHCAVGMEIARRWRFPLPLEVSIGYHHAPDDYPGREEDLIRLVRVVHLACLLADMFHARDPRELGDRFIRRSRELLGLDEKVFHSLAAGVHEEVAEAAESFGMNVAPQRSIEEILQEANLRLGQITLSYEQTKQELVRSQMELIQLNRVLQGARGNLHGMAEIDDLTGAYNHRYLQVFLEEAAVRSARFGHPLILILLEAGETPAQGSDAVAKGLYSLIRQAVRPSDVIARVAENRFALVLPDTELDEGAAIAKKIVEETARHSFGEGGKELRITASAGVASRRPGEYGPAGLMQQAEGALREAGGGGKGRIVFAGGREDGGGR